MPITLVNPVWTAAGATAGTLQVMSLDTGVEVQVGTNIGAASGAPNTTPQTPVFTFPMRPDGGERTLNVSAIGIGAVPTTVTANLLVSYDVGLTWQTFATAMPLVAGGVAANSQVLHMASGALFAFSISSLTLGGATGVNIDVTLA